MRITTSITILVMTLVVESFTTIRAFGIASNKNNLHRNTLYSQQYSSNTEASSSICPLLNPPVDVTCTAEFAMG
eukprot:7155143-Ditylum_brightwellii.AAC.1